MNKHETTVDKYAVTCPHGAGHDSKALRSRTAGSVQALGVYEYCIESAANVGADIFSVPGYGYKRFGGAGKAAGRQTTIKTILK